MVEGGSATISSLPCSLRVILENSSSVTRQAVEEARQLRTFCGGHLPDGAIQQLLEHAMELAGAVPTLMTEVHTSQPLIYIVDLPDHKVAPLQFL